MYPRCLRPRCQDLPVKKNKARSTYGHNNPAFELGTGRTSKDQEHLHSEIPGQHSFNEQYQVPNNAPVYQAFKKDYAHKTSHYRGEPRHVYENFGKHDDQTEV